MSFLCLILDHSWGPWSEKIEASGLTVDVYGQPYIQIKRCKYCKAVHYRPCR